MSKAQGNSKKKNCHQWKRIPVTSTRARVFRLGDNVGLTPLAARTSSGVLL